MRPAEVDVRFELYRLECKATEDSGGDEWVDRKRIPVNFGKLKVNPGDPPPYRESLTEAVRIASDISTAVGLEIAAAQRVASPMNR
jgi:hypothetical protein